MAPQSGADRGPPPEPERGPTTLLLTLFRRTPPMAIRLKREGRKRYLETDTIADWVEALSMGLPIKGPPAFAKLFGTPAGQPR